MDSKMYWLNREMEQRKCNIQNEKEYQKRIQEIYQNMIDEIEKEINGFYGKYARKEGITIAEARKRASKADIEALARKAKRYVKDKDFSKQANEEMRLYNLTMKVNRLELLKAQIGLEMVVGFDEMEKQFAVVLTERTISEFERQAGILGKTIQNNAKAADAIVNASFHNATYSDRIWMYQDMLKNELSSLLQTGLIQGQNPRKLATHLRKRFGVSQYNAERLMITELARVQTEAQKQSFERNGFEEYTFLAVGSACPECKKLDGKHFKVKDMMPGENAPPIHPNCRCSTAAYEDSDDYEAWLDFLDKGGKTDEWNRLKKKETVPQIKLKDAALRNYNEKEINEIAKQTDELINKYVKKKSKWSGKIIVDDNAEMYGKLWNCNIVTKSETCAHIILHEQLHARSISYYDEITYINFKKIEEATVELLAQEIGLKEKIKLEESYYDEMVDDLRYINKKLNLYKNNLQFSVELLNKNVDERLDWLDSLIFDRMMKGGTIEKYEEFAKRMDRLR
nr:minor capsid protein [uncultured Anaerostipes sp.]